MVGERELIARRAAQADRVPDVGPRDLAALHQHRALELPAVGTEPRRAVGLVDRAMGAEPGCVPAARGEGPYAGDLVAAIALDRLDPGARPPSQHGARIVAEDRLGDGEVEIGGRHRAAAGLAQAPGGAGVAARNGFDDMEEGDGIGLDPVRRARHQQAKQPRLVQLVQKRRRQPALVLDFIRSRLDDGPQRLGTGDHRRVTGEVSGRRDQRIQGHPLRTQSILRLSLRPIPCRSAGATCPWFPARRNNRPPRPSGTSSRDKETPSETAAAARRA